MRRAFQSLSAVVMFTASATAMAAQQRAVPTQDPPVPEVVLNADRPLLDLPVLASLRQDVQQEPPERFRPLDELPPEEQYPAAPLIIGAYGFVMLALFGYVLSVARRLGVVQREVDRLERDLRKSGRT